MSDTDNDLNRLHYGDFAVTHELVKDLIPMKKIQYVFTVVMPLQELPNNELAQRAYLDDMFAKLKGLGASRVGIMATMEEM